MIECASCGTIQRAPEAQRNEVLQCVTCDSELERASGRSIRASFAIALSALLMFIPANTLPFMSTHVLDASRTSYLVTSLVAVNNDGWTVLAGLIGFVILVAPLLRMLSLIVVLGALLMKERPAWLGPLFRWSQWFNGWAMLDVMLIAIWVSYARLKETVSTTLEDGGICLIVVGLLTMWLAATLDVATVWRKILPEEDVEGLAVSCSVCERVMPARMLGENCARCGHRVRVRKPQAVSRAAALTVASFLLYIPANLFPMATLPINLKQVSYTVLGGVIDLVEVRLIGLALLVFTASFAIPFLKLAGLAWCIFSAARRSQTHLKLKTKLYHAVEALGRWSMVDPLVLACFVPVTQYNTAIGGRVEPAAPAFTAVVILTVIAAKAFDPRLMWDAIR